MDLSKEIPTKVLFSTTSDSVSNNFQGKELNIVFNMDPELNALSKKSGFRFGKIDKKSLLESKYYNKLKFEDNFVIKFKINLIPFESQIVKNTSKYSNSPFRIKIDYYRTNGKLYYQILNLNSEIICNDSSFEPDEREIKIFRIDDTFYYVANTNSVLVRDSIEKHVDFQIIKLNSEL